MNLAKVISRRIGRINPNKTIMLMRWKGQSNTTVFQVEYYPPVLINNVQVQPTSDFITEHLDGIDRTKIHRSFWIPINAVSGFDIFEGKGRDVIIYQGYIHNIVHIYDDFQNGWKVVVGAKGNKYEPDTAAD